MCVAIFYYGIWKSTALANDDNLKSYLRFFHCVKFSMSKLYFKKCFIKNKRRPFHEFFLIVISWIFNFASPLRKHQKLQFFDMARNFLKNHGMLRKSNYPNGIGMEFFKILLIKLTITEIQIYVALIFTTLQSYFL